MESEESGPPIRRDKDGYPITGDVILLGATEGDPGQEPASRPSGSCSSTLIHTVKVIKKKTPSLTLFSSFHI